MISYKKDSSYDNVFHQANKFMSLVEQYNIGKIDFFDLNVLYINILLASELYLKSILLFYDVSGDDLKSMGHNLLKLYDRLPINKQSILSERFLVFYGSDLRSFLNKIKCDFVDCRYMFVESKEDERSLYFNGAKNLMYELNHLVSDELYGRDTYEELK